MKLDYYIDRFNLKFHNSDTERQKRLIIYELILNGEIYDNLQPFYCEYDSDGMAGKYVPLCQRRPSIKYKLAKIIVNEISSMLFGESHFPKIRCGDSGHENTSQFLQEITRTTYLPLIMINAVKYGSVGSVAIVVKYLKGKFAFEIIKSKFLKPTFDQFDRNTLTNIIEKKYLKGKDLLLLGYQIKEDEENTEFCLMREWNETEEIYYIPFLSSEAKDKSYIPDIDESRSVKHDLGFVPVVWIRNPHSDDDEDIDGNCLFSDIIDMGIEIDYQLSQHGRLLKYNSDPTLVIKDPTRLENQQLVKGIGALMIGEDGDAKYLQLDSGATESVIAFVKQVRQMAVEVVRGDRANPDKLLAGNSGKALQMLNKPMISLVDEMRVAYGEIGLVNIYKMIYQISLNNKIDTSSLVKKPDLDCLDNLILDWSPFYPATEQDKSTEANTLTTLIDSGTISHRTAITTVSSNYNITDIAEEIKEIEQDQKALAALQPQIKEIINN